MSALPSLQPTPGLNDRQRRVVQFILRGFPAETAVQQAGYASDTDAWQVMASPVVQLAIREALRVEIRGAGAALAVRTLKEIAADRGAPAAARSSASRTLLEMAGFMGDSGAPGEKSLSEMTPEEMLATYRKLDAELGPRTINAEITPISAENQGS